LGSQPYACGIVLQPENSPLSSESLPPSAESSSSCSDRSRKRQMIDLVIAIAEGTPVADWAAKNNVPRRTAFRWAKASAVRTKVEELRREILDQAVGRMTSSVTWATQGIFDLARNASSESVRLSALRTVTSDMMAISKFGGLEDRMTKIEERLDARARNTTRAR
jgi:hypothetical protein